MLAHPLWQRADDELINHHKIFSRLVDIFLIACAIGIKDDKCIPNSEIEYPLDPPKSIGRNTYLSMNNSDLHDILYFLLQNAIITSKQIDYTSEDRLKLAFNPDFEDKKFSPPQFLVGFANYGIEQMYSVINNDLPSVAIANSLHQYLSSQIETGYEDILAGLTLEELIQE